MFLQRLSDVCRTTSFRLAMLFLVLFGLASLVLFGFRYGEVKNFMQNKVDEWVLREEQEFARRPVDDILRRLKDRAIGEADAERSMALFDKTGARVAGTAISLPASIPDTAGPFNFKVAG